MQVAVRCRPLNDQEKARNTLQLVNTFPDRRQVKINYGVGAKKIIKTFTFDKVFGQYATQEEVFRETVLPIVDEALQGYNCTVFAYGQTGTGKTHTMEGNINCSEQAGIIPRAVRAIFEKLDEIKADYTVRVSFLELYNEELQDLLAVNDNLARRKPLRLCEDSKRGVTCQNLEEIHVLNADHIFEILARGIEQRQTAATNCNKNSSRSHSIFTLKIMIKELADDGNEAIRHGQLNLVDLAGSECIGRSGAKDQRAREAGNINQSLLTLGRVITALVDHHGHVPYRDSKLTRLLQESLGGRAKTCIIATLSPAQDAVDESMSTLDYAHRAKNIRNKPEVNQRMSKTAAMREQAVENEQLRLELQAQREKNGVYLPVDVYDKMQTSITSQEAQIAEAESVLKLRQEEVKQLQEECNAMLSRLEETQQQLNNAEEEVAAKKQALEETKAKLAETTVELCASNAVVNEQVVTENFLAETFEGFRDEIVSRRDEVTGLQAKIGRFENYQHDRIQVADEFCQETETAASSLQSSVQNLLAHGEKQSTVLCEGVAELLSRGKETCDVMTNAITAALEKLQQDSRNISTEMKSSCTSLEKRLIATNDNVASTLLELQQSLGTWISEVDETMQNVQSELSEQQQKASDIAKTLEKNCSSNVKLLKKFMQHHNEKVAELESQLTALQSEVAGQSTKHQQEVQQHVATHQEQLEAQAQQLVQQMTSMLAAFSTQAQTACHELGQMGTTHSQQMATHVSQSVQQLHADSAAVKQLTDDNIAKAMQVTSSIQTQTVNGLHEMATRRESAASHISSIQNNVTEKMQHLQSSVTTLTGSVATSIDAGRNEVKQTASMAEKLVVGVQGAAQSMQENASGAVDSFNSFMEQHGDSLQDTLHEHFEHLNQQLHNQGHTIADLKESTLTFQAKASQELQVTGATPKPKQFQSLAKLRRTRDHEEIRSEVRNSADPSHFPGVLPFGADDDEEDTENMSPASTGTKTTTSNVSRIPVPASKRRKSGDSHQSHHSLGSMNSQESVRPLGESSNWAL